MGDSTMNVFVGWDLGGAHVKAALVRNGRVEAVWQVPCPLWQGMTSLDEAVGTLLSRLPSGCIHGLTMTGEMVDLFKDRQEGVWNILRAFGRLIGAEEVWVYESSGIIPLSDCISKTTNESGSKNWLIPLQWLAGSKQSALVVDIGSTTTDIAPLRKGEIVCLGSDDRSRLEHGELVYMGVVRTPLMALTRQVSFGGCSLPLMAEYFATTADVYRILDRLPPDADQAETADGGPKTVSASITRIARMIGCDSKDAPEEAWIQLAGLFMELQMQHLTLACLKKMSSIPGEPIVVVGAGVGRFLLPEVARRLGVSYRDFSELIPCAAFPGHFSPADCAPAVALALLLDAQLRQ